LVSALLANPKNTRTHSPEQVAQIANSIREFGFTYPVLIDELDQVIAGHGRILGAQTIGLKQVPVLVATGWSETQKRAYAIADNAIPLNAGWNMPILRAELSDLKTAGFDMPLLGFPNLQLVDFMAGFGDDQPPIQGDADDAESGRGELPELLAPFPYFGGKRSIATEIWKRLGSPKQYIEPFCGSAAVLLAAPAPASLEVVNDASGFIANFWRATKFQAAAVAEAADYPVSHIDLGARHGWLLAQRERVGAALHDPDWPGDAKVAGWWLWGQCCWIGSGWCDWFGQVPHASDAGRGVQAIGKVPHASDAGRGVQAIGQVPHAGNAGRGESMLLTSCGRTAMVWLRRIADRLERTRITHGDWTRCLNNHFGGDDTAVFLDPPYRSYEALYSKGSPVADAVCAWARANQHLRVALCGHAGDYALPGWTAVPWDRGRLTYSGGTTTDKECVWYSPACDVAKEAPSDEGTKANGARIRRPGRPRKEPAAGVRDNP
jgi:hypothetical protein